MRKIILLTFTLLFIGNFSEAQPKDKWISLFNGRNLSGWFERGNAKWYVEKGVLTGEDGMGHIYTDVTATDFEFKGMFRISGEKTNSGFYFRAVPPADDPNGFPRGYEAQICNNQEAYTGWLWKPGKPTGKALKLLTQDGEWFSYRILVQGSKISFWVNETLVMTHEDDEYKTGHFAIQGHNPGMKIEAKELYYREL